MFQAAPRRIGQEVFVIPVRLRQIQKIDASKKKKKKDALLLLLFKGGCVEAKGSPAPARSVSRGATLEEATEE